MNEYDDPYKLLANSLVVSHSEAEIKRLMKDDEYILKHIIKETRNIDFYGDFLDCIVDQLLRDKKRMEFMHRLDRLAEFFMDNLDLPRLRSEILRYASRYGIEVVE